MSKKKEFDPIKASNNLSQLELRIKQDNIAIDVIWFRQMVMQGIWSIARHNHSSYEFHFVRSGNCRVVLDNNEFVCGEGEFYINPPGVFHSQHSIDANKYIEYCLNCDIEAISMEKDESYFLLQVSLE